MSEKLKRILTGIQSTGIPHLGNILGAIIPAINFSKQNDVETYLFIADFHSLTQIKDSKELKQNTKNDSGIDRAHYSAKAHPDLINRL